MKSISIGVDPGSSSGAIAIIKDGILETHGINRKTEMQLEQVFSRVLWDKGMKTTIFAIIERVHSMKGQGLSSTFKFGMNYGYLRACLISNHIPFRDFLPKEWQKHYSMIKKKNEVTKVWKTRLLNVAQNLYPKIDIPLYAADAVLLAHFAFDLNKTI